MFIHIQRERERDREFKLRWYWLESCWCAERFCFASENHERKGKNRIKNTLKCGRSMLSECENARAALARDNTHEISHENYKVKAIFAKIFIFYRELISTTRTFRCSCSRSNARSMAQYHSAKVVRSHLDISTFSDITLGVNCTQCTHKNRPRNSGFDRANTNSVLAFEFTRLCYAKK